MQGYTIDGSAGGANSFLVKCLATGRFDKYDENSCQPVRCGKLPSMKNATLDHVLPKRGAGDNLNYAEKALYKCLPGFSAGGEPDAPKMFIVSPPGNIIRLPGLRLRPDSHVTGPALAKD